MRPADRSSHTGALDLLARPALGAAMFSATELGAAFARPESANMAIQERLLLVAASAACAMALQTLLWAAASVVLGISGASPAMPPARPQRRASLRAAVGAAVAGVLAASFFAWKLTAGRQISGSEQRLPWVLGGSVAVALVVGGASAGVLRLARAPFARTRVLVAGVGLVVGMGSLLVERNSLVRLYPAFHVGLVLVALAGHGVFAVLVPIRRARVARSLRSWAALMSVVAIASPGVLRAIGGRASLAFYAEESLALTGKLLAWGRQYRTDAGGSLRAAHARSHVARAVLESPAPAGARFEGRDVLLITVDALRADRVEADRGAAPVASALAALGSRGAVFDRVYTATPHTSYALASLFCSTWVRAALDAGGNLSARPSLASVLRDAGYRTAAFYPPAVFYVDASRLGALAENGFGFGERAVDDLPAVERAGRVMHLAQTANAAQPLFVWAHFFEPHEPYDSGTTAPVHATAIERYDAEVRGIDAVVADLATAFQRVRPAATVVITSDHGEEFGEHGGYHHGTTLFDEQVRVPLIWLAAGTVAPSRVRAAVSQVDIGPTIAAGLGLPTPSLWLGRDLGPLLSGTSAELAPVAFAQIEDGWMATDGNVKIICPSGDVRCRSYDLSSDPLELAPSDAPSGSALELALRSTLGTLARRESEVGRGALGRAALGDAGAAPELLALLGSSSDAAVVADAARLLGELGHEPARASLRLLAQEVNDPGVRIEAAVAAARLGDAASASSILRWLEGQDHPVASERGRRALLVLAETSLVPLPRVELAELAGIAADRTAPVAIRSRAIASCGQHRVQEAYDALVALLGDPTLRTAAAIALGELGDRDAIPALSQALATEPYMLARAAEARALVELGDRRVVQAIWAGLAAADPLPGGVELLVRLRGLVPPSGGVLASARALRPGAWTCDASGCLPGQGAALRLRPRGQGRGHVRILVRLFSWGTGNQVAVAGQTRTVGLGAQELAFDVPASEAFAVSAVGETLRLSAVAAVTLR